MIVTKKPPELNNEYRVARCNRRLEVVGARKNGRARRRLTPRVSPSRAPVLSFSHYLQAPATQAKYRGELYKNGELQKNWGYIRMNVLKFLLLYIVIIIIFLFTKITKFSYDFTGLLLSTVNKNISKGH